MMLPANACTALIALKVLSIVVEVDVDSPRELLKSYLGVCCAAVDNDFVFCMCEPWCPWLAFPPAGYNAS
jgi:hypothetical protein